MADLTNQLQAAAGASTGVASDANFQNTVLLLHGDGTNGAQNNTFIDSSTNNFTITRNGNTTQGTFTPFSKPDGRWGNYFAGSGAFLTSPNNTSVNLTSGDWCIDGWFYANKLDLISGGGTPIINKDWVSGSTYNQYAVFVNTNSKLSGAIGSGTSTVAEQVLTGSTNVVINTWNHFAFTLSGSTLRLFLNGVLEASLTKTITMGTSSQSVDIGTRRGSPTWIFDGYMSNVRIVKGSAVYTAAFTPPATPSTAITNTSLLTCQSNRFIDNSSNNFAITRNGDVRVTPFSPFPITTAYSTSVNGGAGYFDGSGDALSVPYNAAFDYGTGDFTIEAWVYLTTTPTASSNILGSIASGGTNFEWRNANQIALGSNNVSWRFTSNSITWPLYSWLHIAVTRASGVAYMWLNGTSIGSGAETTSFTAVSSDVYIGRSSGNYFAGGYIGGVKVTKGGALYTSAFTPPTSPFTTSVSSGSVSLLANFTNAGIFDNTGFNALETVGNAQIDTTTKKYGTGSMEFDGTGDWLQGVVTPDLSFGIGNFTIEGWINVPLSNSTYRCILSIGTPVQIYQKSGTLEVYFNDEDNKTTYIVNGMLGPSSSISANTWHHFAVVRNGTTFTAYVDGVAGTSVTSVSAAVALSAIPIKVGVTDDNTLPFTGYIDDLRITKGIARYTSNFTPPTAALPDLGA
jgi:hypothetical protein